MTDPIRTEQDFERIINTLQDERAASFDRLAKAVGGVACTPYRAKVDIEIEGRIKSLVSLVSRQRAMLERVQWGTDDDCAVCGAPPWHGHGPDCALAALLTEEPS